MYGRRPSKFSVIRKIIKEVKSAAHWWPPGLRGRRSWLAKRLINQPWRVRARLLSQRWVTAGKSTQGSVRASAIKGMPKSTGLINWSNMLKVMVSFRFGF